MKHLFQSVITVVLLTLTSVVTTTSQAQNVLFLGGTSTALSAGEVDALRVRTKLLTHDGNPLLPLNATGTPSLVGSFNPGAKWIGIGAPNTTGNLLYGERTQWNGQAFIKALRQRSAADSVKDAILEWGGNNVIPGNINQIGSEMQFRYITNPTSANGFIKIQSFTTAGNSYFGTTRLGFGISTLADTPKVAVTTASQIGIGVTTTNSFGGYFRARNTAANVTTVGVQGIVTGGGIFPVITTGTITGVAGEIRTTLNASATSRASYGIFGSAPISSTAGNVTNTSYAGFFQGDVYATNNLFSGSDAKYKTNVANEVEALSRILRARPVTYNFDTVRFNGYNFSPRRQHGFIAQELQQIFPEIVQNARMTLKDTLGREIGSEVGLSVSYASLISVLFRGIQEQQAQINDLRQRLGLPPVTAATATTLAASNQATSGAQLIAEADNPAPAQRINTSVGEFTAADFKMEQNVPNPFSGNTVIRYTLPNRISNAFIGVYNLQGTQLLRFDRLNGGSQVTINGNTLQPGIYIYSLVAEGQEVMSKRMVVSR